MNRRKSSEDGMFFVPGISRNVGGAAARRLLEAGRSVYAPRDPLKAIPSGLPEWIDAGDRRAPLVVVRSRRVRRLALRVDAASGAARLTLPARTSADRAVRFVAEHRGWLDARVAQLPEPRPFASGTTFPFDGGELLIDWSTGYQRRVRRDGDRLCVGGSGEALAGRITRWLKAAALAELTTATLACAFRLQLSAPRVAVGDQRTRWGSCSSGGVIRYSWRLILAPPSVRASVVAHEVAHLVHRNHGAEFWNLANELDAGHVAARRWLGAHGANLHWLGRDV